jgi:hypothetical protein
VTRGDLLKRDEERPLRSARSRRYLCGGRAGTAFVWRRLRPEVLVKVERPQRSEDVRP